MSKKTSSPKGKKAEMLDNDMIEQPENKAAAAHKETVDLNEFRKTAPLSFSKLNYRLLFIGLGINILGYILMIGGATEDPNQFDGDALFSHTRITLAPLLIVAGFVVIAYSIMRKPKSGGETESAN